MFDTCLIHLQMVLFKWCLNVQVFDRFQANWVKWVRNWIRGSGSQKLSVTMFQRKMLVHLFCSIKKKHSRRRQLHAVGIEWPN